MAAMTFEDLPPRASEIPLTNRRVAADVIDLIISDADRATGCVALMICDSEDRGIQPVVLHDVPPDAELSGFAQLLEHAVAARRREATVRSSSAAGDGMGRRRTTPIGHGTSWPSTGVPTTRSSCSATTSRPPMVCSGSPNRSRRPPDVRGGPAGTLLRKAGDRPQRPRP